MTKIVESKDCGNSPKNKLVQDAAIGLAIGELDEAMVADNVIWHDVDDESFEGMAAFKERLNKRTPPSAVIVEHAISHGKVGAVSGITKDANGGETRFCHILEFTNSKGNVIAKIRSYA